jgi:hypothetical protein
MNIKNAIQRKKIMNWINNGLQQYIQFVKEKNKKRNNSAPQEEKEEIDYNSRFTNTVYNNYNLNLNTLNNIDKILATNTVHNVFDNNIFKEV